MLSQRYSHCLIDSRTGLTDTGGICTALLPHKLVVVFTPNRQSIEGLVNVAKQVSKYRRASENLRPLVVFPLPSRIDPAAEDLRKQWREHYQSQFEELFRQIYGVQDCDLTEYFDEVQLPYKTDYAYGERIAVLEESADALSLNRAYRRFLERLIGSDCPWVTQLEAPRAEEIAPSIAGGAQKTGTPALRLHASDLKILRVVVASPGDVQAERDRVPAVVNELNRGIAADQGLRLEVYRWETDAYPGFHAQGPQGLIDPILRIEDPDVLIGIFWKRFGTSTADGRTGAEHEFGLAYEAWEKTGRPQIMVYFNDEPYSPRSRQETDQWGRVLDFKEAFPKEGLWWTYTGAPDFEKLLRIHLTHFFRHNHRLEKRNLPPSRCVNSRLHRATLRGATLS